MADPSAFDPERIVMEQGVWEWITNEAPAQMSGLESEVLGKYLDGASYQEIAGEMGRPAKTIDNALQRAKRKAGRRLRELC
jgi:RNA polymerase sporulation-specific sigma factor